MRSCSVATGAGTFRRVTVNFGDFVFGVIMATFGAALVVGAGWMTAAHLKMRSRATGTIVDTSVGGDGDNHAVVEFRTQDNTRARFNNEAMAFREPEIGRSVRVRYDPRDHRHARIATFFGSWTAPLVLWLAGGGAFVFGLLALAGRIE